MDNFGEELLKWYKIGYKDEMFDNFSRDIDKPLPDDILLREAYNIGRMEFVIINYAIEKGVKVDITPNFRPIYELAVKTYNDISHIKVYKIFRILTQLREKKEITF